MPAISIKWPVISILSVIAFLIAWAIFGIVGALIIVLIIMLLTGAIKPDKPTKRRK